MSNSERFREQAFKSNIESTMPLSFDSAFDVRRSVFGVGQER
jgi:hypothetical protein